MHKIFISYCREDENVAMELYNFLKLYGFSPWIDKFDLLPGQEWDSTVNAALRKSDFIIPLLSKNSTQKRGYIQREFKQALDFCLDKLESDIFIIPIKLGECEIPDKLAKYQFLDYEKENSFSKIVDSICYKKPRLEGEFDDSITEEIYSNFRIENIREQGSLDFKGYNLSQVLQLNKISNGIEGYLLVLMDSKRKSFIGGIKYDGYTLASIPYFEYKAPCWDCNQSFLLILDSQYRVLYHQYLGREAARIDRVFLYKNGMYPTYILTTDYSAEMGSYNGPISRFFEVDEKGFKFILNGDSLMSSLKSQWVIEHRKERNRILYKTCRPDWRGNEQFFVSKLKVYECNGLEWVMKESQKDQFWETFGDKVPELIKEFSEL